MPSKVFSSSATEGAQAGAQRGRGEPQASPRWLGLQGPEGRVLTSSCSHRSGGVTEAGSQGPPSPPPLPQPDEDSRLLPLLVCLRVLFVPLFMLCHVPERSRLPILFPQDAYFITFMLLFAVSNGYLMSLTMCLAPRSGGPEGGPGRGEGG